MQTTITEFLRNPNEVIEKLQESRSVVLERRDAPSLVLSLKSRQEEATYGLEVVAHLLSKALERETPIQKQLWSVLEEALTDKLPWMLLLPASERIAFVREFLKLAEACASAGNTAPLGQLVHEWKATAAIYGDPELAADLQRPLPEGAGGKVPRPKKAAHR